MNLAIDYYPFLKFYHSGPKVFLNRLKDSLIKQNLCNISSPFLPFHDIALFSVNEKNLFKKDYIIRVDGIYFDSKNTQGDTFNLNKKIFDSIERSKGIIYISEFSRRMVHQFYKKPNVPETVIHNKVPLNIFKPTGDNFRFDLGIKESDRILITSAHWRRHKRLKETIELLKILNYQGNYTYKLIVLGGEKKENINENIFFIGEIKPHLLSKWYRTGDVYVHLAWIEPCGNTQIEAMASGLPVVCCNNGGIGETVKHANAGVVVDCDQKFEMKYIDYYNPPKPNYIKLVTAINNIFNNLKKYKNEINYNYLDIDFGARLYYEFIRDIYNEKFS